MFSLVESFGVDDATLFYFVAGVSLKALMLCGMVCSVLAMTRVRDSVVRHRAYSFVLLGMLAMPAFVFFAPKLEISVAALARESATPTLSTNVDNGMMSVSNELGSARTISPHESSVLNVTEQAAPVPGSRLTASSVTQNAKQSFALPLPRNDASIPTETVNVKPTPRFGTIAVFVYLFGAACLLIRMLVGMAKCRLLLRRSRPIELPESNYLHLGSHALLESDDVRVPVTIGLFRSSIILPAGWRQWSTQEIEMAIVHESEHVHRQDTFMSLLAAINCAIYWFHPLSWFLKRRLSDLAEHACDDAVISRLGSRADYAKTLVNLASRLTPDAPRYRPVCVGMARQASVETRVLRIIDDKRPLTARLSWLKASSIALFVLAIAAVSAGLTITSSRANAAEPPEENAAALTDPATNAKEQQIKGRVVSENDTPAAGAEVRLLTYPPGGHNYDAQTTKTDDNGEFVFDEIPEGKHQLIAFAGDRSSRTKRYGGKRVMKGDENVVLKLIKSPSLSVRVVDRASGNPVPDAKVRLTWTDTKRDHRTNEDGRVTIRGLTKETWTIEVQAKCYGESEHATNLASSDSAEIESRLDPGFELFGKVTDEAGKPVADVGISISPLIERHNQIEWMKTDSEGNYRFPYLPINGVKFSILHDGFARVTKDVTPKVPAGGEQELHVSIGRLPDGGSVMGVIEDTDGNPIAGAKLANHGQSSNLVRRTESEADGSFRLDNVYESLGRHSFSVSATDYAPQKLSFRPGSADDPSVVNVTLEPGHTIKGIVVDEQGKPLEGVRVTSDGTSGSGWDLNQSIKTKKNGSFAFDSLESEARFDFGKSGYSRLSDEELPLDKDEAITVTLRDQGRVRGKVVDAITGKVISPFKVRMTFSPDRKSDEPSSGLSGPAVVGDGEAFSNKDGTFELDNLVQGMPLQITVEAKGYHRAVNRRVVAETDGVAAEFKLNRISPDEIIRVSGEMRDSDGKPMVGAQLRLIGTTKKIPFPRDQFPFNWAMVQSGQIGKQESVSQFLSATTDTEGRFEFERVLTSVEISLAYWGDGVSQDRLHGIEKLASERREDITITVVSTGIVSGSIDRVQRPFINSVIVMGKGTSHRGELSADGTMYTIRNVPPGKYQLQVYIPKQTKKSSRFISENVVDRMPVEVKSDQTTTVNVPIAPRVPKVSPKAGTTTKLKVKKDNETSEPSVRDDGDVLVLSGRVVDEEGAAIPMAQLWMPIGLEADMVAATADDQGRFSLRVPKWDPTNARRISRGSTVWAYSPGHRIGTMSAHRQVSNGSTQPLELTLAAPSDTGFIVIDRNDAPVVGAVVEPVHIRVNSYDIPPKSLAKLSGGVTDEMGKVTLPAIGRDRLYTVSIHKDGFGTQHLQLKDSNSSPSVRTIKLRPTGRLEVDFPGDSAVRFDDYSFNIYQSVQGHTAAYAAGKVPENGRIVIPELAEGEIKLQLYTNEASGKFRPRIPKGLAIHAGDTTEVKVQMEETVLVKGRVLTKPDSKPVTGAMISVAHGSFRQSESVFTDANGEYTANVLAGKVRRQLIMTPKPFQKWIVEESSWANQIDVPVAADTFELPALEMIETVTTSGSLVDLNGEPLAGVRVNAIANNRRYGGGSSDTDGSFKLRLPVGLEVEDYELSDPERDIASNAIVVAKSPLVLRYE